MRKTRRLLINSVLRRLNARKHVDFSASRKAIQKLVAYYDKHFREHCDLGDYKNAEFFRNHRNFVREMGFIFPPPPPRPSYTIFQIDSSSLYALRHDLADGPFESMTYLTGIRKGNLAIPTTAITPTMRCRGVGYVESDSTSTYRVMKFITNTGHTLIAQVHLHPGSGPYAVRPSSLDLATHRSLIACYNMIDIILSRDGYFCIYREKPDWKVEFFGKGVKKIDRNIWKLDDIGPIF